MKYPMPFTFMLSLASFLLFSGSHSFGQNWNWVAGDSTLYEPGVFSSYWDNEQLAKPGSRYGSCTWTDNEGNLWLYGGLGWDIDGNRGHLGDMWKFDVSTNRWNLVGGSAKRDQLPNYGTKGVEALSNTPGGRYNCLFWKDLSGNFWLYGGIEFLPGIGGNYGLEIGKGDLWKYNPKTGMWTFVYGRTEHITSPLNLNTCFGIKGVESTSNDPLVRATHNNPTWTDQQGYLWFFESSQLWRYNIGTNCWTWMSGGSIQNNTFIKNPVNYGTKGAASPTNHPGDRYYPMTFTDLSGDLWIYGGHHSGAQGTNFADWGFLNDLWKYSVQTNEWTWMHGDSIFDQPAVFGQMGTGSPLYTPGARGAATSWVDADGKFWLFGGRLWKNLGEGFSEPFFRNDLWKYDPALNEWAWMKESLSFFEEGIYQEQLIPGEDKRPHCRFNASKWVNGQGLWLFGGSSGTYDWGSLNDLWCFGCDSLKRKDAISSFEMPNIFTPNNDGMNDLLHPLTMNGYKVTGFSILNRWGALVFESSEGTNSWDGTINGEPATEGVYFWKVTVEKYDGTTSTQSGNVTLVRGN